MNRVNITRRVNVEGRVRGFARSSAVTVAASVEARSGRMSSSLTGRYAHQGGLYYIDFLQNGKRTRRAAGSTAAEAIATAEQWEAKLATERFGAKSGSVLPEPETGDGRSLRNAVTSYLLDIKARKKSKTHSAYATALKYFLESCPKQTLEQITRADLLAYQIYLREKKQC